MALNRVLCADLIGRETELSVLEDALLATLRGDGRVVILGGEAGMGKTRLVRELAARARRLNCVVMSGACSEAELSLPYLPFLEALGNHLATLDLPKLRDRLGPAADELAHLFPQMGRLAPAGADDTQAKHRLFESILLLLRDAASSRALLLILEDLQWSDPATRELLDYATRRLRSTNVLILATYRTDEMHRKHALLPAIEGWRRSGQADLIELKALPPLAVADMVCAIFEEARMSDEFRDFLHDRSEGNPFVLEEMLRDALDRGDIFRTDTGWDRKALGEMRIPTTVRDTILHRLERLSREEVLVLSAASVVGRSFDLSTLAAVTGIGEAAVLAALEAAVTHQLLEEEDRNSARYRFRHALTREAVYEDMVVPRRQQLHGRVAEVLGSRIHRASVDLAHHLLMAGRYDEAVVMCVEAAEDAMRARAYRDAAALLERAAPHVRDPAVRGRLLCRAGEAYWNNTESGSARALLEAGIAGLEGAGLSLEAAGHRTLLGRCHWELLRTDLARAEFERARDVLKTTGPSEALAVAYIRLSGLAAFDLTGDLGLADAQRASEIARAAGSSMALAWSWNFIALAEISIGQVDEGFRHMEESYRAALEGGHGFQTANAVYNAVSIAVSLGRGHTAQVWADRIPSAVGTVDASPPYLQAMIALQQGRVREALDLSRTAVQRSRDSGHGKMVWRTTVLLAQVLAESLLAEQAVAELPSISTRVEGQDAVDDMAARVRTHLAAGDLQQALVDVKSVRPAVAVLGSPADTVSEGAAPDPAWLRSFLESMPAHAGPESTPSSAAAHGRLALYEGRFEDAVRHLRRSEATFREEGFHLDAWHVGRALAEAEARSGETDPARQRLEAIASDAEAAGARLAAKLARDTAASLGFEVDEVAEVVRPTDHVQRVNTGERMVSVLFADVRGYTDLSGRSAPADMLERIGSLQRWASQEVARHHGLIDKFAGDAIMATFNISGQSVDHTLQALKAAIAIIDKSALVGLPVGAGIAVGPAVVGTLARSANVSVLGEVTNLAARLQAQSPAGEVTLSEEAHRRVRGWLDERQIASERLELQLKGFETPVVAYRVGAGAATPSGG
ncbi:MAG TPA: AAA family ATPase [Candidatus Dormibacteraeota bacterium]|nr:AAA family ATPase [Candidatus Dormibacteraeota bacterium]